MDHLSQTKHFFIKTSSRSHIKNVFPFNNFLNNLFNPTGFHNNARRKKKLKLKNNFKKPYVNLPKLILQRNYNNNKKIYHKNSLNASKMLKLPYLNIISIIPNEGWSAGSIQLLFSWFEHIFMIMFAIKNLCPLSRRNIINFYN